MTDQLPPDSIPSHPSVANEAPPAVRSLPFAQELAAFLTYMRSEKQYSPLTQQNYQRDLEKFRRYCAQKNIADLNNDKLPDFIINPKKLDFNPVDIESGTKIISNKRFFGKNEIHPTLIHYTTTEGAFRKKW